MEIIIISAIAANGAIGYQGGLPWDIDEEFELFLSFIGGQTIITGRKSYQHSKKMLNSKYNLLLSRNLNENESGNYLLFSNFEEALKKAQTLDKTIFITGGVEVYKKAFPLADKMYLSFIKQEYQGDTFFPEFEKANWEVQKRIDFEEFEFVIFERNIKNNN